MLKLLQSQLTPASFRPTLSLQGITVSPSAGGEKLATEESFGRLERHEGHARSPGHGEGKGIAAHSGVRPPAPKSLQARRLINIEREALCLKIGSMV